ncbi:MAG: glycosyltransferase [Chloroflexi bacterium]|nr:glycosyltransferase [Chloroflexota bacterium]
MTDHANPSGPSSLRVCVVGSGTRFLSGISVYTIRLGNALALRHRVTIVTMRRLLPDRLYPGHRRIGQNLTDLSIAPGVERFDGIDWYWLPSLPRALAFLARRRPQVLILQWWSGTVLHSYLALSLIARLARVRVIVEFHEVIDTGEARLGPARIYVRFLAPIVLHLASGFAVHSVFDHDLLRQNYRLGNRRPIAVLPHGPHDHYAAGDDPTASPSREAPDDAINLLFFGIIRPYKGLEVLVRAFDAISPDRIERYWLTVVGETWEGWSLPGELIAASRYRERITFVNRYVSDSELAGHLAAADAVVLPYLRSSLSGPLHVAMGYGVPIVMTDVGGNGEAAEGYGGISLVPPSDEDALRRAIEALADGSRDRFAHPHSWEQTAGAYDALFDRIGLPIEGLPASDVASRGGLAL